MGKNLYVAEKPSVAREFGNALKENMKSFDGYMESASSIVTWCVGHLVTMSYPEVYDESLRRWSLDTVPFLPSEFKYEVIANSAKQFGVVSHLLNRPDVDVIYVCTDSGREGEYIYRLVEQMAGVQGKTRKRVWIDSQTEEEILRGIREAKDLSEYDSLSDAAYLRAKEDYLMGINFSRVLTLKYGWSVKDFLKRDKAVISVGRVMTCVLGMVVNREREIRNFTKTPFYRIQGNFKIQEQKFYGEWRAVEGSAYHQSPLLYKENGFKEREGAQKLVDHLCEEPAGLALIENIEKKKENKNPPLLYNLAELQNDCSKLFKISPDETLRIVQELYEKKMCTYPRTDARVLSTAVAKEIHKNIGGLKGYAPAGNFAGEILQNGSYKNIAKTRYVNDKQITDHYAIIPTGQGLGNLNSLPVVSRNVYEIIVRRFLSIFYPPAVYQKFALTVLVKEERFFSNFKILADEGYLKVAAPSFRKPTGNAQDGVRPGEEAGTVKDGARPGEEADAARDGVRQGEEAGAAQSDGKDEEKEGDSDQEMKCDEEFRKILMELKKGAQASVDSYEIKEGETSPPKRYNSGSMILAMENAGQLIEDEELRAQIKGSGIGTSATRAEILKKLVNIEYLSLNKKTQILTPTLMGEMIYDVVESSIKPLLEPRLTASWEKGLTQVADGSITADEYMTKLTDFVSRRTNNVKMLSNQRNLYQKFQTVQQFYKS